MNQRRPAGDQGAALMLALIILFVFGLFLLPAVLGSGEVSLKATSVVRTRQDRIYAADAGVEHGIDELRRSPFDCAGAASDFDELSPITIEGRTETIGVQVTCEVAGGGAVGALGWAVITTENAPASLQTQSGGGGERQIEGPTFAGGVSDSNSFALTNKNGPVFEKAGSSTCSTDADKNNGLIVTPNPPFHYSCTTVASPHIAVAALLGPLPAPPTEIAVLPTPVGDCTTFLPGTYKGSTLGVAALPLTAHNYLVSGTYYLENINLVVDGQNQLVGGKHRTDEPVVNRANGNNPVVPCASDPSSLGTGVKLILGGTSRILVDNPAGNAELFMRCPTAPPPPPGEEARDCDPSFASAEGARGVSLMTVPAGAPAGYVQSSVTYQSGTPLIQVGTGSNPALTFHGLVHVPEAFVDFSATNTSEAQIRAGIVAGRLMLQSSSSSSGLVVSVRDRPGVRAYIVTATATDETGGAVAISRAVVRISNENTRAMTIESWQSCSRSLPPGPQVSSRSCS